MTPRMLDAQAFERARRFIASTARPLEVARFRHAFEGGGVDAVLGALVAFQNADGGFGHALEPDLRAPESSALCTSVAFQILRSVGATAQSPIVSAGVDHMVRTLDASERHWRIIPRAAEGSPHAPWWRQEGPNDDVPDAFSLNPTAELLGYLVEHQALVPGDMISSLTEQVLDHLLPADEIKMHELLCCLRLHDTPNLPETVRCRVRAKLAALIEGGAVAREPADWAAYTLRPLQVAATPSSPFMAGLEEAVAANLDHEVASQAADGSWGLTWSWGGAFPDVWERARREWAGIVALEKLIVLDQFGRIERGA